MHPTTVRKRGAGWGRERSIPNATPPAGPGRVTPPLLGGAGGLGGSEPPLLRQEHVGERMMSSKRLESEPLNHTQEGLVTAGLPGGKLGLRARARRELAE